MHDTELLQIPVADHTLAARLDLPATTPRAFAIFAHCFTCNKESRGSPRGLRAR